MVGHGYSKLGLGYPTGCLHLFPVDGGLGPQWLVSQGDGSAMYLIVMESTFPAQTFSVLAGLALVLMVVVTGGVIYLTAADWRDRRRRKQDQDVRKPQRPRADK